jgi:hypothetical protein
MRISVRRVPPHFVNPPQTKYMVRPGGSVNLTCVAVGYPMPRVFWKLWFRGYAAFLGDPSQAPIGKNVLSLTDVDQTVNYTCIAVSRLGSVEAVTTVEVIGAFYFNNSNRTFFTRLRTNIFDRPPTVHLFVSLFSHCSLSIYPLVLAGQNKISKTLIFSDFPSPATTSLVLPENASYTS